ncbi:cupin domain-containing protein [Actinocorallia sp. API 0066]|uniref:(R)-mandelonitrile lyase n=1 Tax=Actinocorallia sp. API 0066 TaxID=2896846 RepID=UPI001E5F6D64|nr:cupin domain-containing protein [Actinocorallia sp. API 0066]MCD0449806.1 cupin domain-containing protein [Actinocorallia sp. API 0066]
MERLTHGPTVKAPAERFTGDAWIDVISPGARPPFVRANLVRFAPGARTAWHRHTRGQTLHVLAGIGLVQTRGEEINVLRPGDTVRTGPGEWHWHGAAPTHFMVHLGLLEGGAPDGEPDTEWAGHVTDSEYDPPPAEA